MHHVYDEVAVPLIVVASQEGAISDASATLVEDAEAYKQFIAMLINGDDADPNDSPSLSDSAWLQ